MDEAIPRIGIIGGTGKEGVGLALRWASAGYKIIIGSRQIERAVATANEINQRLGILTVSGMENIDAAKSSEICVLTIIHSAHQVVLESLQGVLKNKILVDATSRVDFQDPRPPDPPCAALQAREILDPSMKIVAAFQNIPARSLSRDVDQPLDADVLVCSDDVSAAEVVIQLARAAGMRGYYAGNLENANVVEGLTSILISLNKHYRVKDASIRLAGIID